MRQRAAIEKVHRASQTSLDSRLASRYVPASFTPEIAWPSR
jgi:hypothetical protein